MAQFANGLNEKVLSKVERQNNETLHDLFHLAIQVEQQNKRKAATKTRTTPQHVDKNKAVESDSNFKTKLQERTRDQRYDPGKSSNHTRDIVCFKCKGRGHMSRECSNQRAMIITQSGGYESQDDEEENDRGETIYADEGESLVILRVLNIQPVHEEMAQRENLFHTRCTVRDKVCYLIIDTESCTNIASALIVDKLGLETHKHPHPYKLKWLNDKEELHVSTRVEVPFTIGNYKDSVTCDVVPMQAGHVLLGRSWQYDHGVSHNG